MDLVHFFGSVPTSVSKEGREEAGEVAEAEMLRLVGTLWSPPSSAAAASRKQEITEGNRRQ